MFSASGEAPQFPKSLEAANRTTKLAAGTGRIIVHKIPGFNFTPSLVCVCVCLPNFPVGFQLKSHKRQRYPQKITPHLRAVVWWLAAS